MYPYLFLIFIVFIPLQFFAQFGPGGVGNPSNNGLWLRADALTAYANNALVNEWSDFSGNGNDAINVIPAEQPQFIQASPINGRAALYFDGGLDQLLVADAPILDGSAGFSFYSVVRPDNLDNAPRGIIGKRITFNTGVEYAYTFFFWNGGNMNLDIHTQNNRFNTNPVTFANNLNYMAGFTFDGSLVSAQRSKIYEAGNLVRVGSESSTSLPNSNQDLCIGALNRDYVSAGNQTRLGGHFAEMVQYNFTLNEAQRIIVENYLGAKYNIAIANDFFNYEATHAGEVAGIGRIDASNLHTDAQGSAIVRINTPSNLNNNEFLIWGHNELPLSQNNVVDVDGVLIESRMQRVWRASETGDVGTTTLIFDVSNLGPIIPTDLRLLIDRNNNGFFDNDVPPMTGVFAGNFITFTGVDLQDADFFTLGSINAVLTPLPVELLNFDAVEKDASSIKCIWATETETNNDYFVVERSRDGIHFSEVGSVNGAGTSNTMRDYTLIDEKPYPGVSYYRLKQVDFNGDFSYSQIESVEREVMRIGEMRIIPNPNSGKFQAKIENHHCKQSTLSVLDMNGRIHHSQFVELNSEETALIPFNLTLSSGKYILHMNCNSGESFSEQFIIK